MSWFTQKGHGWKLWEGVGKGGGPLRRDTESPYALADLCTRALQGLETTVEESSGSIDRELKEAVAKSNNSFRGAAEGRRSVVTPIEATGAAPTIRGEP